jgi:uncharacterized membrane protein
MNIRQPILEAIALAGTVALFVLGLWAYATLPATIATRFGFDGTVVGTGSKIVLLVLPALWIIIYVALGVQARAKTFRVNLPIEITDANRDAIYAQVREMIAALKALLAVGFAALESQTIASAHGQMSAGLLPTAALFCAGTVGLVVTYTVRMCRQ